MVDKLSTASPEAIFKVSLVSVESENGVNWNGKSVKKSKSCFITDFLKWVLGVLKTIAMGTANLFRRNAKPLAKTEEKKQPTLAVDTLKFNETIVNNSKIITNKDYVKAPIQESADKIIGVMGSELYQLQKSGVIQQNITSYSSSKVANCTATVEGFTRGIASSPSIAFQEFPSELLLKYF